MQLQIRDICQLLNVSERTVYRWIKSGAIPHYKLNEQYRFNRVEILEWATAQKMTVSPEIFAEPESGDLPALSAAIEAGGIHYRVSGRDKESVLRSIVRQMRLPEGVDVDFLLQVLLARESLGSTAIGDGIAIPHPRSPIVLHVSRPIISLSFLETPIDFEAPDGKPVGIIFTIVSPTIRAHLHLLSRLSYALKDDSWRRILAAPGVREEILDLLKRIEPGFGRAAE
ncbi:MAG: Nitrogen regulatory protein [bacterium ADurb.Bin431]|nr:MAG: Nitrogen regulatory protein [bacterium ADurb.Bin431]HNY90679.1 PTS sugar transporter subunit IIA [bacterium]HOH06454.1 PTS sugar transporter subunit IIA [bacterium]HPG84141.1 PTS sugar transporter subunit IIA [bacterium]HPM60516.1 PTS sugar transporter subunit IIA [bacterium]